ncbi:MAG: RNA polymerase sigma factor [Actinomycetota bacterium]
MHRRSAGKRAHAPAPSSRRPQFSSLTERDLVLAFKAGEDSAYAQIYERYAPTVQHIARRLLKNPDDVQEATQETMLRVLQGLPRFNGRYLLQAWVARIATNVCLDVLRARSRRPEYLDQISEEPGVSIVGSSPSTAPDPSEQVERSFESQEIRSVLDELPSHHREALILRTQGGLSHEEMAQRMHMTPSQVKALIHRAKRGFRHAWDGAGHARGASLVLPWMLGRLRIPRGIRRLFGGLADHAGAAAASPTVTVMGSVGSERVAAAVAVVMAAGIGAGAVAVTAHSQPEPKPKTVVTMVAAAPAAPSTSGGKHVRVAPHKRIGKVKLLAGAPETPTPSPSVALPTPSPSIDVESPTPTPSPSIELTPTPAPTPLPVEPIGFSVSLGTDRSLKLNCGCSQTPTETDTVSLDDKGVYGFTQHLAGAAATNVFGDLTWGLTLDQASTDGQNAQATFVLTSPKSSDSYSASLAFAGMSRTSWDGLAYDYVGRYSFQTGPDDYYQQVPHTGIIKETITFSWRTPRIVSVAISLIEDSANPSSSVNSKDEGHRTP